MLKYNKIIQKVIKFDNVTKENIKEHDLNWSKIPDHQYRILITKFYIVTYYENSKQTRASTNCI